jgi:hypothetical protein
LQQSSVQEALASAIGCLVEGGGRRSLCSCEIPCIAAFNEGSAIFKALQSAGNALGGQGFLLVSAQALAAEGLSDTVFYLCTDAVRGGAALSGMSGAGLYPWSSCQNFWTFCSWF